MATSMNALIEDWIERNTFTCPVGKITTKMCEELRKRTSIGDRDGLGFVGSAKHGNPKPTVCETCKGWREYLDQPIDWGEKMSEQQEVPVESLKESVHFRFRCQKHGPHNGGKVGKSFSVKCPKCLNEHRTARVREGMQRKKQATESDIVQMKSKSNPTCVQDKTSQVKTISVPPLPKDATLVLPESVENSIRVIDEENPWREMGLAELDDCIKTSNANAISPQKDVVILDFTKCPWLLEFIKQKSVLPVSLYIKSHFMEMMDAEEAKNILMTQII